MRGIVRLLPISRGYTVSENTDSGCEGLLYRPGFRFAASLAKAIDPLVANTAIAPGVSTRRHPVKLRAEYLIADRWCSNTIAKRRESVDTP